MLEICQILLIFLSFCGLGYCGLRIVLRARASLAKLSGRAMVALEGCVRRNGSWRDESALLRALLSWNSADRPPPSDLYPLEMVRAVSVSGGSPQGVPPQFTPQRL